MIEFEGPRRTMLIGIYACCLMILTTDVVAQTPPKDRQVESETVITRQGANPKSVIPFRLTGWNNISVPAIVNDRIALNLMFHTAVDSISLTKATTDRFPEIAFEQETKVGSWGGESNSRFGSSNRVSIGGLQSSKQLIFEDLHSGHQTDGKFGPEQLNSSFLKLDFEYQRIELYESLPKQVNQLQPEWKRLRIHEDNGLLFIMVSVGKDAVSASKRFLIHSGYSGFALLDDEFVAKNEFLNELPIMKRDELTDSAGNKIGTRKVKMPRLSVGDIVIENVPVAFFEGAIGRQRISLLGGDFLKRFQLVFDLKNEFVYLRKNSNFDAEYFVQKES